MLTCSNEIVTSTRSDMCIIKYDLVNVVTSFTFACLSVLLVNSSVLCSKFFVICLTLLHFYVALLYLSSLTTNSLPMHVRSISSNLVELLAVDCTDEEAIQELRVLVDPTVKWVKTSHTPRSGRLNATVGGSGSGLGAGAGTGTGAGIYGNIVDNMKLNGTGPTTNRYTNNYNNKNNNSNSNNRNSYGKSSTNYGYNKIASNAVSSALSSAVAGATSGLGDDAGLSLGKQFMQR